MAQVRVERREVPVARSEHSQIRRHGEPGDPHPQKCFGVQFA